MDFSGARLSFREQMDGQRRILRLKVTIEDLQHFLDDQLHTAKLEGTWQGQPTYGGLYIFPLDMRSLCYDLTLLHGIKTIRAWWTTLPDTLRLRISDDSVIHFRLRHLPPLFASMEVDWPTSSYWTRFRAKLAFLMFIARNLKG